MKLETKEDIRKILMLYSGKYTESNKNLFHRCIEKAKRLNDLDLEFEVRYEYLEQLTFQNHEEDTIPIFPWFLNVCDEYPGRFNYRSILWAYKWIVIALPNYSSISKAQITAIFNDFEKRYRDYGRTQQIIAYYKMLIADSIGEVASAYQQFQKISTYADEKELIDCRACMMNRAIDILVHNQRYEEALVQADTILKNKLRCMTVPKTTYPEIVYIYMFMGKEELAEKYSQLAYKNLKLNEIELCPYANLLLHFAVTHKFVKGKRIIERQLAHITPRVDDVSKAYFYQSCALFFEAVVKTGKEELHLEIIPPNEDFPKPLKDSTYALNPVITWFRDTAYRHATLLDTRNENTFYKEQLKLREDLVQGKV